jgi:hypothetical protein
MDLETGTVYTDCSWMSMQPHWVLITIDVVIPLVLLTATVALVAVIVVVIRHG